MVKRTLHLQNFNTTYSNFRISHVPALNNFEGSILSKQIKDKITSTKTTNQVKFVQNINSMQE